MDLLILLEEKVLKVNSLIINFDSADYVDLVKSNFLKDVESNLYSNLVYLSDGVDLKILIKKSFKIYILFNTPEFFDSNLLKSKILTRFKRKYNFSDQDFIVEHPALVILKPEKSEWNKVVFTYDPKQGDISLELET